MTESTKNPKNGLLRRALHKLTSPEIVLDAEEHQELARESGATPVGQCPERTPVRVVGMLRTVTIQPRGQAPCLQAELWDGTGSVELVWVGRRRIPGIEPGRSIKAEGRITRRDDGRRVIFNPKYELLPAGAIRE
ncbi:MAG: OB-fold nucleic acid binding domain-containing protein [Acidothermus sp.]|nr:OB-fold nucleic acid binding domain-containing protein [Acidothermus sp.]